MLLLFKEIIKKIKAKLYICINIYMAKYFYQLFILQNNFFLMENMGIGHFEKEDVWIIQKYMKRWKITSINISLKQPENATSNSWIKLKD